MPLYQQTISLQTEYYICYFEHTESQRLRSDKKCHAKDVSWYLSGYSWEKTSQMQGLAWIADMRSSGSAVSAIWISLRITQQSSLSSHPVIRTLITLALLTFL